MLGQGPSCSGVSNAVTTTPQSSSRGTEAPRTSDLLTVSNQRFWEPKTQICPEPIGRHHSVGGGAEPPSSPHTYPACLSCLCLSLGTCCSPEWPRTPTCGAFSRALSPHGPLSDLPAARLPEPVTAGAVWRGVWLCNESCICYFYCPPKIACFLRRRTII